jgi:DNA-directed RNA polymerase subunit N (RpoN/RPB10)
MSNALIDTVAGSRRARRMASRRPGCEGAHGGCFPCRCRLPQACGTPVTSRAAVLVARVAAADGDLVERGRKQLRELGVARVCDRHELLGGHQQRPREALGVRLVVEPDAGLSAVDGMAVETQGATKRRSG